APLFHGFSPHDVRTAVKEQAVLEIKRSWPEPAGEKAPKTRSGAPPVRGEPKFGPKNVLAASLEPKKYGAAPAVTGTKFVLPSRSAHSSRVIKPNKRFLQSSSPERNTKRSRVDEPAKVDVEPAKILPSPISHAAIYDETSLFKFGHHTAARARLLHFSMP
ncbi:unnamed protein product, partial [Nesidiocoris tenuis]